ncbi:MAG TPA: hypothetical protein VKP69_26430 [Isosphaeraceae bacterium]|jgi:hypothetical protein|nr:hypothetical protein [Isosphaeraceae bacterium]
MSIARPRIASAPTLLFGLALGWGLARGPAPPLRAHGSDRSGESILTAGPVMIRYDEGMKIQVPQDALYLLDYKAGRLLATIPTMQQSVGSTKMIDLFAERDLVADFKLDVENGPRPHFLMTTGALGVYSGGWAPLYVFESTTKQVAIYRVEQVTLGRSSRAKLELVELRSFQPPAVR